MRIPGRLRGLTLGTLALIAGPPIAMVLTSQPAAPSAAQADTPVQPATQQLTQPAHVNLFELRPRTPLPSPTPTPTPTPEPTPTPTPTPTPAPVQNNAPATVPPPASGDIVSIIRSAAAQYGVSGDWMVKIAECESGLRSNAYNPSGPYYGLFQFLMSTFKANGGTNIWDPTDQATVTARMLANGQAHQWACA